MKSDDLFRAIGSVDDDLLERSENIPPQESVWKKRTTWFRIGGVAVTACLAVFVVTGIRMGHKSSDVRAPLMTADMEEEALEENGEEVVSKGGTASFDAAEEKAEFDTSEAETAEVVEGDAEDVAETAEEAPEAVAEEAEEVAEAAEEADWLVPNLENYPQEPFDIEDVEVQQFEYNEETYVLMAAYTELPEEAVIEISVSTPEIEACFYQIPDVEETLWLGYEELYLEYVVLEDE